VPLEDFTLDEVKKDYKPYFVDPGRTHAFTAVSGFESSNVEVRRCSTTEYYTMTGSIAYLKKLNQKKSEEGITAIESGIPTAKTVSYQNNEIYLMYILQNMRKLFTFYDSSMAEGYFRLYQGQQRAAETMANMFINGSKKYNKKGESTPKRIIRREEGIERRRKKKRGNFLSRILEYVK
jgi:hypothetical protein